MVFLVLVFNGKYLYRGTNHIYIEPMRLYKKLVFLLALLFFYHSNAQNSFSTSELERFKRDFKRHVESKMKKHNVTGASIAIRIGNQLILDEGFGFADKSNNIKATKNTEYPIGSVSKIVTATTILKLYSDGLIDIDKPYTHYVRDFSMKSHFKTGNGFTVRHLLAHYAGLPRLRAKGFMKKEPEPLNRLLINSKEEYLIAPPGKVYQYSDWGTDLLALLVERVSKMPYEEYVEKHIFTPLQMNHSYFGPVKSTKGYDNGEEMETYGYSYSGSDGVTSSASDMLKIVQLYTSKGNYEGTSFLNPDIVKDAIQKQCIEAPLAYDTETGLMWDVRDLKNGNTRIKKAGIHEPFFTYIFFIPEYSASIVICSNSNSSSSIHWDSWTKLYSFLGKKHGFPNNQSAAKTTDRLKKTKLTENQFKKIEGSFSTSIGIMEFRRNGDKFDVYLSSEGKHGVGIPYTDGLIKLYVKAMGIKVNVMDIFWDEVDNEIVIGEQHNSGRRTVSGLKIDAKPIPDSWNSALGTYLVDNYDDNEYRTFDTVQLNLNSNNILEIRGSIKFPRTMDFQLGLSPISDSLAIIPGYNFDFFGGETVKLEKTNNIYYLTLSGYKFKRLN